MAPPQEGDATRARGLLRAALGAEVGEPVPLAGGFFSRAFAIPAGGREYVVRLNGVPQADRGFAKDDYAWRHFASPAVPIPRVVATGHDGGDAYAIAERVAGRTLAECDWPARRAALPALLDAIDAIGRVDVGASRGFGDWAPDGDGLFASWRDYLAAAADNAPGGFYADWHALFRTSFLERDVYDAVYAHLLRLLPAVPETRGLIHNDLWFENVLADGPRISGVIDWANAVYGDPLYDIARLLWGADYPDWWYPEGKALLLARYGALPGFAARVACYECHFGLDDLRFYATTGKRDDYVWARDRLLARIAAGVGLTDAGA